MATLEERYIYEPARATEIFRNTPRFGHTNDFTALVSQEERSDYLQGLLFIGILILCVFSVWTFALLVLKCLGKYRVGFWSGSPFTSPGRRPSYIRLVFGNACIIFIIFTVLLVTQGLTNLRRTVDTVGDSNAEVHSLLTDAKRISTSLRDLGQSSMEIRDALAENLGDFCPGEPNIEQETGINFDALAQEAITQINLLGDFLENDVTVFQSEVDDAISTSRRLDRTVDAIQANDWESLIFLVPNCVVGFFLLLGVILAFFNKSQPGITCGLTWIIIPLLFCVSVFAWVLSAFTVYSAVANVDFCSGGATNSPDGTVYRIMDRLEMDKQDYVYKALDFYISQCTTEDPFAFIRDYQEEIELADKTVTELYSTLDSVSVAQLNIICDKDFGPFEGLLDTMVKNLSILAENAEDTLELLSCDRIVPIYVNTVYGGTCTYSVTGITWTWSALLVVGFMGMLMFTFRAAVKPDNIFDADDVVGDDMIMSKGTTPVEPQETYQSDNIYDSADDDMSSVYLDNTVSFEEEEESRMPPPVAPWDDSRGAMPSGQKYEPHVY